MFTRWGFSTGRSAFSLARRRARVVARDSKGKTMSREIYNERVAKFGMTLPGRDDESTDCSRGYVGWGPGEDATCDQGRTVEHADWESALSAIQNPAREIHDFYFHVETPSKKCECCAGSGRNKDYAELYHGFYRHNGGRWAGWGDGPLHQNEIDALLEKGRLGRAKKGDVTPANVKKYLGLGGHDAINHWILTPIRAANLGLDCNECFDCVGTGLVATAATRISLYMWTFDPMSGTSRVDTAEDVRMEETSEIRDYMADIGWEGVKRRFGWPSGDNMHANIRYEENFRRDPARPFNNKGWWSSSMRFNSLDAFKREWGMGGDPDLNLIFDYRIITDEGHFEDNPFASSELPETFAFQVIMTHPRKGADRTLLIENCSADDGEEIKNWLRQSYEVHGRHFAWAAGREFGNEKRDDAEPEADTSYEAMKFFTGR